MKKNNIDKFEEGYFTTRYQSVSSSFTEAELDMSRKWFYSWIKKINNYIDIYNGSGKKALEIGCGIAGPSSLLKEYGYKVTATDVSKYAVERASKLNKDIKFQVYDCQKGVIKNIKYDLIINFEVLEHLEDPKNALINMYKMLNEGGILVSSTPFPYPWIWDDPTHINVRYPNDWMNLLRQAGFVEVEYHKFSLLPKVYKYNKKFQIALPFHIPFSFINNPIIYIAKT